MALNPTVQNPVAAGGDIGIDTDSAAAAQTAATAPGPEINSPPCKLFPFRDMHLLVGDRLQVECPAHMGVGKVFVRTVGYVEAASLIVTTPTRGGQRVNLVENDLLIVRAFSRQSAFAFRCSVLRACRLPFDYLHLSFPDVVHGSEIRKSTRVRVRLAARCAAEGGESQDVILENISSTGMLLAAERPPGAPGDSVRLDFAARVHDVDTGLRIEARIVSIARIDDREPSGAAAMYRCGLEFGHLQPGDHMVIKGLVYQQIIENPASIV